MRPIRVVCALAAIALVAPHAVAAQDQPAAPSTLDPTAPALAAEVDAIGEGDQSKDPKGDLVKLADLERRFAEHGAMPPMERGLLASAFGAAHFWLREFDPAAARYEEAAALFTEANAPPDEIAGLYSNQATIYGAVGKFAEAEHSHRRALAIRRTLEPEGGPAVASSLFGIGFVYFRLGRIEEAIPLIREAVDLHLRFSPESEPLTVVRMTSLASVLGRSGREAESLAMARAAEERGRRVLGEEHATYAIALNNLGNALIENGLHAEAIPVLRETLRLRVATMGEKSFGVAVTLRNLATALKMTGDSAAAEDLNRQAIAIYEATGERDSPEALGYMYAEMARFAADRGDWAGYDGLAARALAEADERLDAGDANRAIMHLYHAELIARRGEAAAALAIAEQWVPVVEDKLIARHKDRIWSVLLRESLRRQAGGMVGWDAADAALAALEAKLGDLGATDRQLVREAAANRAAALLYLELAAGAGDEARILRAVQLANISDLAQGQQFAQGLEGGADDAVAAQRALLDLARREDELHRRQGADPAARDALAAELAATARDRAAAEANLRARFPEFAARFRPRPVDAQDLARALGPDDLLVMPVESDARGWAVTVDGNGSVAATRFDAAELRERVARIRRNVALGGAEPFPLVDARAIHAALFPNGTGDATRLLLHGGDSLGALPLGLLLTAEHSGSLADAPWLARSAAVQVVGNLALMVQGGDASASLGTRVVGIGGAEPPAASTGALASAALFRSARPDAAAIADLAPLPGASAELEAIVAALPGTGKAVLVGPDALEENFKRTDLASASVLAFATHGLVSGELRGLWEPALLLGTAPGSGEDGLLGASEIARLRLDADWVILSACNTAAGDGAAAPAYSGLATAFAQAGGRTLMLSHWRVRDDAAARLSVDTVRGAASGLDRAEALRRAQLALMADSSVPQAAHPAIWAPFVIVAN